MGECVLHAVYLINRTPSSLLQNCTPYQKIFGKPPVYTHIRMFDCLCYSSTHDQQRQKFDSRATKCIFLGFKTGVKGYKVMDMESKHIFLSRDVIFYEDVFPLKHNLTDISDTDSASLSSSITPVSTGYFDDLYPVAGVADFDASAAHETPSNHPNLESVDSVPESADHVSLPATVMPSAPQHSTRKQSAPAYLEDYVCSRDSSKVHVVHTSPHSLDKVFTYGKLSNQRCIFSLAVDQITEPKSYQEAMQHQYWRDAYKAEVDALEKNQTGEIVDLPLGKHPIGCKIVYRIKFLPNGEIERCKIRVVAKGYAQQEGVDFLETFSLVAKMTSIRVLLAMAAAKNWFLHQLDVNNAFLHGELFEEV